MEREKNDLPVTLKDAIIFVSKRAENNIKRLSVLEKTLEEVVGEEGGEKGGTNGGVEGGVEGGVNGEGWRYFFFPNQSAFRVII